MVQLAKRMEVQVDNTGHPVKLMKMKDSQESEIRNMKVIQT
jgi:hypothetical protein